MRSNPRGSIKLKQSGLAALGLALALAACTAVGERTTVSVGYYTVSGDTFGELDQNIKLHGPNVTGVGKALASTDLRMIPDIRYERRHGMCEVSQARISVKARVTLPRHANERKLKKELASAWNNLEECARSCTSGNCRSLCIDHGGCNNRPQGTENMLGNAR